MATHARHFDHNARALTKSGRLSRLRAFLQPEEFKQYPLQMEFELSNSCNLECAMCSGFCSSSIRANREKLPPLPKVYDAAFVEQLKPFIPHLKNAKFYGGEPFLIDIYYKIWDLLIERNPDCIVSITTNGTVYTKRVERVLEKLNCQITVSLDSIVKTTYEAIRINANMEQTLANLEAFCAINQRKNNWLSIAVCPMISNWREMPELVSFASERGINVFFNTVVFPADHSIKALPRAAQQEIVTFYRQEKPAPRNAVESANYAILEGLSRQIEFWMGGDKAERTPLQNRCAELLIEPGRNGMAEGVTALLSDLVREGSGDGVESYSFESGSPLDHLKTYFRALWEVGAILASEGLLANVHYDQKNLNGLLDCLENDFSEENALKILLEIRRFPKMLLNYTGSYTLSELIELIESRFGIRVQAV